MEKLSVGDIVLIILFIISITIALWALLGSSPSFEQMILAFILTAVFGIAINVAKIGTELKLLRKSFNALARDFKEHIKHK